jgi:prepilin-type N-terminal cleavage/methylation domain-containing protein
VDESGFSIIELLIVSLMIGILAALAIPNYAILKTNAYNAMAASDARNISPAADLKASSGGLPDPVLLDGTGGPVPGLAGATTSNATFGVVNVQANRFSIETFQERGTLCYRYDSDAAGGWEVVDKAVCSA